MHSDILQDEGGHNSLQAVVSKLLSMDKKALGNKIAEVFLKPVSKDEVTASKIYRKAKGKNSEEIWNILREESEAKLAQMETATDGPMKVMKAFNERMECEELMAVQGQGKSHRHKSRVALMFKASEANLDRTALLMANNPLLTDHSSLYGGDSPAKYFSDDSLVQTKRKGHTPGQLRGLLPPLRHPPKPRPPIGREASSGVPSFRVQFSEDSSNISFDRETDEKELTQSREVIGQNSALLEPLTLSALLETATTMPAPGQGAFRYGQVAYWNVTSSPELPPA